MSFGGFLLGALMMAAGFFMVSKTNWFIEYFGDLGSMLGVYGKSWMSWKLFGIVLLFLGFMIAFGLFTLFFQLTFGQIFTLGGV